MDKSFLDDVPGNTQDEAVVRAIVDLGATLNLQLVAEGVETHEQAQALADLGCPFGQGYYFARPVPFHQALQLIAQPSLPAQSTLSAVPDQNQRSAVVPIRRYGA
jgi:EAL domain-containing protein (putative c-di-GMP-specific phosphodiesterase class I)